MRILLKIAFLFLPLIGTAASSDFLGFQSSNHSWALNTCNNKFDKLESSLGFNRNLGLGNCFEIGSELNSIDTNHRINSVADVNFVKVLNSVELDSQYRILGEFEINTKETVLYRISDVIARKKIKVRALKKAKQIAALMGAELAHVEKYRYSGGGYSYGRIGYNSRTTSYAIPNELLLHVKAYSKFNNSYPEALSLLKDTNNFEVICEYFLRKGRVKMSSSIMVNEMHIDSIKIIGGLIFCYGRMAGTRNVDCFRLVSMNEKYFFLYYTRKEKHYQIQVRR
jgi:hypothetical protein